MKRNLAIFLSSGGYAGYFPLASGTAGTVVGVALVWLCQGLSLWLYIPFVLAVTAVAVWASSEANRIHGEADSSRIVIDEIVGYLITMIGIPITGYWLVFGFVLFRFFDIIKLPPARYFDTKVKTGLGVVMDDVVAGIYSNVLLHLAIRASL